MLTEDPGKNLCLRLSCDICQRQYMQVPTGKICAADLDSVNRGVHHRSLGGQHVAGRLTAPDLRPQSPIASQAPGNPPSPDQWPPGQFDQSDSPHRDQQQSAGTNSGIPVALTADRNEIHFVLNVSEARGINRVNQQQFVFVGIRAVRFQDATHTAGWCTDPSCPDAAHHAPDIISGRDFPSQSAAAFAADSPLICHTAAALLAAWDGFNSRHMTALRSNMQPPAADSPHHVCDFQHAGKTARAVWADILDFRSWAVLLQHSSSVHYFCCSCSDPHTCKHVAAGTVGDGEATYLTLSAAAFEKKLRKDFDIESGMRGLACMVSDRRCKPRLLLKASAMQAPGGCVVFPLSLCQKSQRLILQWQRCCEVSSLVWISTMTTNRPMSFQVFSQGMPGHPNNLKGTQSQ